MGLIVDSTVFIAAERRGLRATQALGEIDSRLPGTVVAISVITLAELAHGAARATTPEREKFRRAFIQELAANIPVLSVTSEVAIRAGEMDGRYRAKGMTIGFADLLIAATALEFEHQIVTANVRHFNLVPGLSLIEY